MRHPSKTPLREPLFRLLFVNAMAGATAAVVAVGGLILVDVGGIGTVMLASHQPLVPILMMTAGFVLTLSSAAMGVGVMRLGRDDKSDGGSGLGEPIRIPVRAETRRR